MICFLSFFLSYFFFFYQTKANNEVFMNPNVYRITTAVHFSVTQVNLEVQIGCSC